jgi:hypothetical protein
MILDHSDEQVQVQRTSYYLGLGELTLSETSSMAGSKFPKDLYSFLCRQPQADCCNAPTSFYHDLVQCHCSAKIIG